MAEETTVRFVLEEEGKGPSPGAPSALPRAGGGPSIPPARDDPIRESFRQERREAEKRQEKPTGLGRGLGGRLAGILEGAKERGLAAIGPSVGAGVAATTGSPTAGGIAGTMAGSAAGALGAMGPIGLAIGGIVLAGTALKESFQAMTKSIDGAVESVEKYSGAVAGAQAVAQVRELETRIERGRRLGGRLAGYVDIQSQVQRTLEEIRTEFISTLLPLVRNLLEVLNTGLQWWKKLWESLDRLRKNMADLGTRLVQQGNWIEKILGRMLTFLSKADNQAAKQENILEQQVDAWLETELVGGEPAGLERIERPPGIGIKLGGIE